MAETLARACDHLLGVCMEKQADDNLSVIAISLGGIPAAASMYADGSQQPALSDAREEVDKALADSARQLFTE
jgi:hypothetical protein